jgi:hypothetical protein
MTEAFNRFMSQAGSQGREYGDGFNSSHFDGLTQSELTNVLRILEERALDGDTIAINATSFINLNDALSILEKVLSKSGSLGRKAINQASLEAYKITRQRKYLDNMFDSLDLCSEQEKWHCIQMLCSIEYGSEWFEEVKAVFEKVVLDEQDEVLRHLAAKKILLESGISEGTTIYQEKIKQLINEERKVREKALSDL